MKKLLSIVLSAIMAVTMCTAAALPAFAADPVKSPTAATLIDGKVTPTVNGENKQGVIYGPSSTNSNEVTFRYDGEGTLIGWETNLLDLGLVSGTDFTLVNNDDGSMTVTFISQNAIGKWNDGMVKVNALVDFDEEEPTEEEPEEEETTKNESSKSPSTGASTVAAASIAAAGAGIAVLAAVKKRDAE
ncbi:MAG: hypothetical protein PUE08_01290 [Eubacteriales bacterium]|nr:hypothetical protein [Eubacteriales bacterium]